MVVDVPVKEYRAGIFDELLVSSPTTGRGFPAPYVVRHCDLGPCVTNWCDDSYLATNFPQERKLSVHVSTKPSLHYGPQLGKNFKYEMMHPTEFFAKCRDKDSDEYVYFRALHKNMKKSACLEDTLSESLASEFIFPIIDENLMTIHSSIMRCASKGVSVWLHYDTFDNYLCCVSGRKRVWLFPPDEIGNLYVPDSSSDIPDPMHISKWSCNHPTPKRSVLSPAGMRSSWRQGTCSSSLCSGRIARSPSHAIVYQCR